MKLNRLKLAIPLFGVVTAFAQDPRVTTFNQTGDKAAPVTILGYRGTDNKSYVLSKDPTIDGLPVNIVNGGAGGGGDLSFLRNGVSTNAALDTSTATNNRPAPFTLLAGDSLGPVDVGSGNTSATTLRFRLVNDQTIGITCAACATESTLSTASSTLTSINGKLFNGINSASVGLSTFASVGFSSTEVTTANRLPVQTTTGTRTEVLAFSSAGAGTDIIQTTLNQASFGIIGFTVTSIGSNVIELQRRFGSTGAYFPIPIYNVDTGAWQTTLTNGNFLADLSGSTMFRFNVTTYVSGTTGVFLSYTGNLGRTLPQNISATSLPLPTGAATEATLSSLNGKVTAVDTGNVTVAASALPTGASTEATLSSLNGKVTVVDTGNVTVSASALPTGAATEATISSLNGKVANNYGVATGAVRTASQIGNASGVADFGSGAASSQTLRVIPATDSPNPRLGKSVVFTVRQSLASDSINTTYDQITASTSATISKCSVFWPGDEPLWLATGASSSEVVLVYVPPGGMDDIPVSIASGTRLAWRSEASTYNTGYGVITCYGI